MIWRLHLYCANLWEQLGPEGWWIIDVFCDLSQLYHDTYIIYLCISIYNIIQHDDKLYSLQHWFQGTHAGESHLTQPTSKGKLSLSRRHLLPLFECQYENWEQRESNGICAFRTCKAWRGCIWHGRMFYWVCYGVWWCVMVCECVWWCVCVTI